MAEKEALQRFHKDAISNAADELFQQYGIEKTTMDDIARKADYSKATVYVYFKSKTEIIHYIELKAMRMLLENMNAGIAAGDTALRQYKEICSRLVQFADEYPFYFSILQEPIAADTDSRSKFPILDEIYTVGEQINDRAGEVIRLGKEQGYFVEESPNLPTGFLYWSMIFSTIRFATNKEQYIQMRMGMDRSTFLDFAFRTMIKAILNDGINYDE